MSSGQWGTEPPRAWPLHGASLLSSTGLTMVGEWGAKGPTGSRGIMTPSLSFPLCKWHCLAC